MTTVEQGDINRFGSFRALGDVFVDPEHGLQKVWHASSVLIPILVLLICFCLGSGLQSRALHNVQATSQQQNFAVDSASLTQTQRQAVEETRSAPVSHDVTNWAIGFVAVIIVLGLGAVLAATTVMIGGGTLKMLRVFAVTMYIAVPTLGLYLVLSGLLIGIEDPTHFETYASLTPRVPSISYLAPFVTSAFWRAFWGAINPFSAWALFLYFVFFAKVAKVNRAAAIVGASIIVVSGAILQGLVAMIST